MNEVIECTRGSSRGNIGKITHYYGQRSHRKEVDAASARRQTDGRSSSDRRTQKLPNDPTDRRFNSGKT